MPVDAEYNKHQNNLVKRGITHRFYSTGGSSYLQLHALAGVSTPKSLLRLGARDPHLTQCVIGPHKCTCQMTSKYVERFKQGARM